MKTFDITLKSNKSYMHHHAGVLRGPFEDEQQNVRQHQDRQRLFFQTGQGRGDPRLGRWCSWHEGRQQATHHMPTEYGLRCEGRPTNHSAKRDARVRR